MAPKSAERLDTGLTELPQAPRWREWMARVEAVGRDVLAREVGRDCALDLLIKDISAELAGRPYEIARIAGVSIGVESPLSARNIDPTRRSEIRA
ncbi:hypothetical protein M3484_21780 [Pseudomonas sp. GX19020]|uniref:hypothetical protein n=1 Tax=Pseudomonas sp. GX19020 TaxID=2942277 RepID=UPI0020186C91|nr:hypothetical protein [Pseudomonas sp. GX19020]MCL4069192.1 hypothetical protein [Pseudomonas sp. GX19020]